ncbi:MAG: bifunctional hydroxymethylpyrimidine kinase/phosphomethylpyrimidine kinase [Candidatus Alcyoniella australis]|nr:bifunctional hydroxymethylpyrimidine kinase/phosphomethylpyrimidine kinase [Candidatus Alcyoniella australis]
MKTSNNPPIALAVAGLDPSGGAGLAADLSAFAARGVWGCAVATAATVQTTAGVTRYALLDPSLVREQIERLAHDMPPHAIKLGMLGSAQMAHGVAAALDHLADALLVIDPVLRAWDGTELYAAAARDVLQNELLPRATLIAPNAPEAAVLCGVEVHDLDGARRAAHVLLQRGARAVLIKGGHLNCDANTVVDLLVGPAGEIKFERPRIAGADPHGTGCLLTSLIAAGLARGEDLPQAIGAATGLLDAARLRPLKLGAGKPLLSLLPLRDAAPDGDP